MKTIAVLNFAFLLALQCFSVCLAAETPPHNPSLNVMDYGANGDGHTDNTVAFQRALDAAASEGGGIVEVPAGKFMFKGHLNVGANTTIKGIFCGPPGFLIGNGTVLMPTEGRGDEKAAPFISVKGGNSTIMGLAIFYPEQLHGTAAMRPGQPEYPAGSLRLKAGEAKVSPLGKFVLQTDGNLAFYDPAGKALWATDTAGKISSQYEASFQGDGNLVLYESGKPYWSSGTNGHDDSTLVLSNEAPFLSIIDNKSKILLWPHDDAPDPYPWTIADASGPAGNVSVINVTLINPYNAMKLSGRHFVSGVYGQPLRTGISVDNCLDIGRIENVHFWPFWSHSPKLTQWVQDHGVAFEFARDDWQYMSNCFCLGYHIGYRFYEGKEGPCNGSFVAIGSDSSGDAIVVEQSWPYSLQITNGEFVADKRADSVGLRIMPSNTGVISLHNCSFWGKTQNNVHMQGSGRLVLNGCQFSDWNRQGNGAAAVVVDGGSAIITGNLFLRGKAPMVQLTNKCQSAVVTSNMSVKAPFTIDEPHPAPSDRFSFGQNVSAPQ